MKNKNFNPKTFKKESEKIHPYNQPFDRKTIAEAVEYVFKNVKPEKGREFKILAGCKTYGTTDLKTRICQDPECKPCHTFNEAMKKHAQQWADEQIKNHKDEK